MKSIALYVDSSHHLVISRAYADVRQLEQTGRIFAAVNDNPKVLPVAQATKLKKDIPVVNERFHEALDQLEDELVNRPFRLA